MTIRPITLREANAFVEQKHRHNGKCRGCRFCIGVYDGEKLLGVAICGNPVSRRLDDGLTLEIRRVCTDGTRNACSKLYSACVRAGKAMGYKKVITYTLVSENGASVKAANFTLAARDCGGIDWNTPSRPREATQQTLFGEERKYPNELKNRWEIQL